MNVSTFRDRLRIIVRSIDESLNISESIYKFKHITPIINEVIEMAHTFSNPMGKVYVVISGISIGEARLRIMSLLRVVDKSVAITEDLSKLLQEGLVKTSRAMGTFTRGKTVRVSDKTKDVKLHDKSKTGRLADRIKNIKVFKRRRGVRGV